jgi:hypothetical protein
MYLVGTVYNLCIDHARLTVRERWGRRRTPAMAAGLTDHYRSVAELLNYRVPPVRGRPPSQRGRRSQAMQDLIKKWPA